VRVSLDALLTLSFHLEIPRHFFAHIRSLFWLVHPPTAYCFAKHVLVLLPTASVSPETRLDILELSRFLTELSVIDYFFVIFRPSNVAVAALLNAMETVPGISKTIIKTFMLDVKKLTRVDLDSDAVTQCRSRLRLLYAQGGYARPIASARTEAISPVCVSYGCNPALSE
jgi:Cyclin, C-terminal domain